jgi:hypothetical protein
MHQEGKEPVALTNDQVINIIQVQQAQVKELTAKVAEIQSERDKLERSLLYVTTANIGRNDDRGDLIDTNDGASTDNQSNSQIIHIQKMLSNCLSELSEKDETLKKLKGLYMKSIVEVSELKRQLSEMKRTNQPTQIENQSNQSSSDPIRLIIEEDV